MLNIDSQAQSSGLGGIGELGLRYRDRGFSEAPTPRSGVSGPQAILRILRARVLALPQGVCVLGEIGGR